MVTAIVVGGGASTRMGFDKVWADLRGRPLLAWPLLTLANCELVDQIILVIADQTQARARTLMSEMGIQAAVVAGGARRRDSVFAGLQVAQGNWVLIHDAARPLLASDLIVRGIEAAKETGAAIAAVPETNTVKRVRGYQVEETLDRSTVWAAQTPQVFRRDLLVDAYRRADFDATDDAALVEAMGVTVKVYEGSYANIKVTTPIDLQLAAILLSQGAGAPAP